MGDWITYGTYCYDFVSGQEITAAQIAEDHGFTEADWETACQQAMLDAFDKLYTDSMEPDEYERMGCAALREEILSADFMALERFVYVDAQGQLILIAPLPSLAGAAYYYHEIPMQTGVTPQ